MSAGVWLTTRPADMGTNISDLHTVEIADDALFWTSQPLGGPQAVWDAETNRTWVAFLKSGGNLYATYYDHATGDIATPVLVAAFPFGSGADFHHTPAVMLADDGKMHIIYGGHNAEAHRHYRMNTARTLSGWTAQTLNAGTYPFACTTDTGELIFMDRPASAHGSSFPAHEYGSIYRCTNGSTWTRTAAIDTTGSPEAASDFYQSDLLWADGRVRIVWTVARGAAHDGDRINVYYAAFDPDTTTWYNAAGTSLGATITWAEHADCLVHSMTQDNGQNPRMSLDWHHGHPVIAMFVEATTDNDLLVAEWDGSSWDVSPALFTRASTTLPAIISTPDELTVIAREADTHQFRRIDGEWEDSGLVLRWDGTIGYEAVTPVRDGPGVGMAVGYDISAWPGDDDTVTGPLMLLTRRLAGSGAVEHDHDGDYAGSAHTHAVDETVFAPGYTVTDGTALDLDITFVWGIDSGGDPYYNSAGVTAGEEAVLVLTNSTGELSLRPVEV